MPFEGDFGRLRQVQRSLTSLATSGAPGNNLLLAGVDREVKQLVKSEFETGVGPFGKWQETKRRRPAMISSRFARVIESRFDQGSVRFFLRTKRDMLTALHEGHSFPARSSAGQSQFYDRFGRQLRLGKLTGRGLRIKFVEERRTRAHAVGARVLPPRPVFPDALTPAWEEAVGRGITNGMQRWYERTA